MRDARQTPTKSTEKWGAEELETDVSEKVSDHVGESRCLVFDTRTKVLEVLELLTIRLLTRVNFRMQLP